MDELTTLRLVDVGARGGIDPRWAPFHSCLDVIAFEPDPIECAALNARSYPYRISHLPVALGAANHQSATLHITRAPGCSSLLTPNQEMCGQFPFGEYMQVVKSVPVTVERMDSVVTEQPDVMKLDTQGTELHILQGAGALLDDTIAVELEVEFVEQYVKQPLFADVDAFMRSKGFQLRGLRRTYWRAKAAHSHSAGGQIIHGDALYFRPQRLRSPQGLAILAAYRQYDQLAAYGRADLIPHPGRWHELLGRLSANREMRRFIDKLRPATVTDWHDPDFY